MYSIDVFVFVILILLCHLLRISYVYQFLSSIISSNRFIFMLLWLISMSVTLTIYTYLYNMVKKLLNTHIRICKATTYK